MDIIFIIFFKKNWLTLKIMIGSLIKSKSEQIDNNLLIKSLLYLKITKKAYNKKVKTKSYTNSQKIWLNSKLIKNKKNYKLETNFFQLFYVLYVVV